MFLLDTNTCIFLIKNKSLPLLEKIMSCNKNDIFISSITVAELEYGVFKSHFIEKNHGALINFLSNFNNIIDFSAEDTEACGVIRAYLEKKGVPIGPYDLQIASQGLTRDLTVITGNVKVFSRIPSLKVQDWTNL